MRNKLLELPAELQRLMIPDEGQDLVEYALLMALIASALTAGMSSLASDINSIFIKVGGTFAAALG